MNVAVRLPTSSASSPLTHYFFSMRPSERRVLKEKCESEPDEFLKALSNFLELWAKSTWLEDYNVERVGNWVVNYCPKQVSDRAIKDALSKLLSSKVANNPAAEPIKYRTYQAFVACVTH